PDVDAQGVAPLGLLLGLLQPASSNGEHHIKRGDEVRETGARMLLQTFAQLGQRPLSMAVSSEKQVDRSPRQPVQHVARSPRGGGHADELVGESQSGRSVIGAEQQMMSQRQSFSE